MKSITISMDVSEVSNTLKCMVNSACEDGFKFYPEAVEGKNMSVSALCTAIHVLDEYAHSHPEATMTIEQDDSEEDDGK